MIFAIELLSFLCLFFVLAKYEWGISIYFLYLFLVPFYYLYFGSFIIGENLFSLIILIVFIIWSLNKGGVNKICLSIISPFLFLFIIQAILIPFHSSKMPLSAQLNVFRIDIMRVFLPFVILSIVTYDKHNSKLITRAMYVTILISALYGIFLISMPGHNPYIETINHILNYDLRDQEAILDEGLRTFGYISSVYPHVTEFGYFLIFSSVYLLYRLKRDKTILPKVLLGLVLVCAVVCGSRSVLMAEGIILVVYLCYNHQFKILITGLALGAVAFLLILHFMPNYLLFLNSIGDTSANGSSINLRIEQFQGCLQSLKSNPVFGLGYGWAGWYRTTIGRHPTMLSFESNLIQILCNNGLVGLIIWGTMVFLVFKQLSKYFNGNTELKNAIVLLLIGYFGYTFFTGDYGTFQAMMVFYALIFANEISYQSNERDDLKVTNNHNDC